jgi:hypothetical protein
MTTETVQAAKREWVQLPAHPRIYNPTTQLGLASLLLLEPGWYVLRDLALAMERATGITAKWAENVLRQASNVGVTPVQTVELRDPYPYPRDVRRSLVRIVPHNIALAWSDFAWPAAPRLAIEPLLADTPHRPVTP